MTMRNRQRSFTVHPLARFAALAALAALAAACSLFGGPASRYVVPEQPTAEEQYRYAALQHTAFRSPLNSERRPEMGARTIAAYQAVLDNFPDDERYANHARLGIAWVQDKLDNDGEALRIYEKLIAEAPNDPKIQLNSLFGAAVIYDENGKPRKAKDYYREIIQRFSEAKDDAARRVVYSAQLRYNKIREE